ncbi:hypothetical protein EDD18DRAFT_1351930 [Armillaria luteobubalina]|uniref:Uncharacterized protein n=1 Tax=Armillaria luteobubalina TaxID=153913 RepID=A0AA39Q7A4_9AGAR|nr:hypothetical protein EDD18DRAFT_1351930 [Armillaria luteobubalina]
MAPQKLARRKKHTPVVATVPVVRCSHNATAVSFVLEEDSPLHPRHSIAQGHKQGEQARAPKRKVNGVSTSDMVHDGPGFGRRLPAKKKSRLNQRPISVHEDIVTIPLAQSSTNLLTSAAQTLSVEAIDIDLWAEFEQAPAWKRLSNTPVRETPLFIPDEEDIKEDILEYPYSPAMFTLGQQPSPSPVFIPASILTSPVKPGAKIPRAETPFTIPPARFFDDDLLPLTGIPPGDDSASLVRVGRKESVELDKEEGKAKAKKKINGFRRSRR